MDNQLFCEKLKQAIEQKGITQRELADKVGITEVAMSRYIKGDRVPKGPVIVNMANALDISVNYLIDNGKDLTIKDLIEILSIKSNDRSLSLTECLDYHRAKLIVEKVYNEIITK